MRHRGKKGERSSGCYVTVLITFSHGTSKDQRRRAALSQDFTGQEKYHSFCSPRG